MWQNPKFPADFLFSDSFSDSFLRISSYLLEKSFMENFIFFAVLTIYFFFTKPNLQNHNNLVLSPVDAWVIPKVVQPTESF